MVSMLELTDEQRLIIDTVREFVDDQVIPVADEMEHRDEYPEAIVEQMKQMGLFGVTIPEQYGGLGERLTTYAHIVVELARGWMSLSGILNTHFITSYILRRHGTDEQRNQWLPKMATGEVRAALSMSEPGAGSDVASITCRARREGDEYVIDGQKMWVTNGLRAGLVTLLVKTDPSATPPHRGISILMVSKPAGESQFEGITVGKNIPKLGYKGVETTELTFDGHRVPASALLGGTEGQGFRQVMDAIEVGRVNVAARAVGVASRALEEALRYAQQRKAFGKTIAEHQGIQFKLAEMATKVEAARLMMLNAAQRKDAGERSDLEAGMAKLFASEMCHEVCLDALRVHGGYGYSAELTVERLYRDAPFLLIGEGTSEIQKMVIARQLLERHRLRD
jgi:butyryl-CoA dehydrogenase